jgi:hypothetical protein
MSNREKQEAELLERGGRDMLAKAVAIVRQFAGEPQSYESRRIHKIADHLEQKFGTEVSAAPSGEYADSSDVCEWTVVEPRLVHGFTTSCGYSMPEGRSVCRCNRPVKIKEGEE